MTGCGKNKNVDHVFIFTVKALWRILKNRDYA